MALDLRPPLGPPLAAFGRPVVFTAPGDTPIDTVGIVHRRPTNPAVGALGRTAEVELSWVLALPRSDVPTRPPISSTVTGDLDGSGSRAWRVDRVDNFDADVWRVVLS